MGKKLKRIFSVLLAVAMLITSCPVSVYAEENETVTETVLEGETSFSEEEAVEENTETAAPEETAEETIKETESLDATDEVALASSSDALEKEAEEESIKLASPTDAEYVDVDFPAFNVTSDSIDGVKVTVTALEGVFPAGSKLSVKKVLNSNEDKNDIEAAIDNAKLFEEEENEDTTTESYTFDIKVLDKDGNEIEPKDETSVNVKFELVGNKEKIADAKIYHLEESDETKLAKLDELLEEAKQEDEDTFDYSLLDGEVIDNVNNKYNRANDTAAAIVKAQEDAQNALIFRETSLVAIELDVQVSEDTNSVVATTDGFSYYVVQVTYDSNTYSMGVDEEVSIDEIIETIGLSFSPENITSVSATGEEYLSVKKKTGLVNGVEKNTWFIKILKEFNVIKGVDDNNQELTLDNSQEISVAVKDSDQSSSLYTIKIKATYTKYIVKHYQQNANDDDYTLFETIEATGAAGEYTENEAKTYDNFKSKAYDHKEIAADGSTVIDVYYDRDKYTVSYNYLNTQEGVSNLPESRDYKVGATVTVAVDATAPLGYTFSGWDRTGSFEMPAASVVISGSFTAKEASYGGIIPRTKGEDKAYADLTTQIGNKQSYIEETHSLTTPAIMKALTDSGYTADETCTYQIDAYLVTETSVATPTQGGYRYSITPKYDVYATNGTDSVKMAEAQAIDIDEEVEITLDIPSDIGYESGVALDAYHYGDGNTLKEKLENVTISKDGKTITFTSNGFSDFEVAANTYVAEVTVNSTTIKYADIAEAITYWQTNGGTLKLLKTCDVSSQITPEVTGSTIDFNGYTINAKTPENSRLIKVSISITLNLTDSSTQEETTTNGINATGIKNNSTLLEVNGTLNLYKITMWKNICTSSGGLFFVNGTNAVVNMYSGTIKDCSANTAGGAAVIRSGGTFNLIGGTITGNAAGKYAALYADDSTGRITISGGSIYGNGDDTDTALSVGTSNAANLTITGGSFGEKALMDKLGTDYVFIEEVDGDRTIYSVYKEPDVNLVAIINHTATEKSKREYYISYEALAAKYPNGISKNGIFTSDTKAKIESGIGLSTGYRFITNTDAETKTTYPWTLQAITYKNIIYKVDGVQDGEAEPHIVGDPIVLKAVPAKVGHTFSGWSDVPEKMPNNDLTVTGTFSANPYTVTYMVGGEQYSTESHKYNSTVTLIAKPEISGYEVGEWTSTDVDIENGEFTMPAKNVVISATKTAYTEKTVTYKLYGSDKIVKQESYTPGDNVTVSYSQVGYDVVSMTSTDVTITDNAFVMPNKPVTIIVKLQVQQYTLTWINEGVESSSKVNYGSPIVAPTYEKTGHTLSWDKEVPATMPANDVTITAVWTPITYRIIYKDRGGADCTGTPAVTSHTYGTATDLGIGTKDNATHEGWYTDSACTNKITVLGATDYTADITIYANWKNDSDVAAIGNKYYATIPAAIEAAQAGETIEILQNIPELPDRVTVNKSVTIDIKGKLIKSTKITSGSLFTVSANATIKNGKIDSEATAISVTSGTLTTDDLDVWANINNTNAVKVTSGKVIISDGKFGARGGNAISATTSASEITGGYFNGVVSPATGYLCIENDDPTYIYRVVTEGSMTFTITLDSEGAATHGSESVQAIYTKALSKINPPTSTDSGFTGYFTEAGGKGTKIYNADGTPAVAASPFKKAATLYAAWSNYVAEVNNVKYMTLHDAVAAAKENDTVYLLADVDVTYGVEGLTIGKSITLDLQQHKIEGFFGIGCDPYIVPVGNPTVTIKGASSTVPNKIEFCIVGTLIIEDGIYEKDPDAGGDTKYSYITVYPGGTFTAKGGTCDGDIYNAGTVNIKNDTIITGQIKTDANAKKISGYTKAILNIEGGTYTNTAKDAININVSGSSELNISGGTFTGNIRNKYATASITGGTFNGTLTLEDAEVTINGGTLNSYMYVLDGADVNIKNIDMPKGPYIDVQEPEALLTVEGGTFNGGWGNFLDTDGTISIVGGKYATSSPQYVPDTHMVVDVIESGTTWYYVFPLSEAWVVGTSNVGRLTAMINVAQAGSTIKLMTDVLTGIDDTNPGSYELKTKQTLDINGKKLHCKTLNTSAGLVKDSALEGSKGLIITGRDGLWVAPKNGGTSGNGYIPLYDQTAGAYKLFRFALTASKVKAADVAVPNRLKSQYSIQIDYDKSTKKGNYASEAYDLMEDYREVTEEIGEGTITKEISACGLVFVSNVTWDGVKTTFTFDNLAKYNNKDIVYAYGYVQISTPSIKQGITTYFNVDNSETVAKDFAVTGVIRNTDCNFSISADSTTSVPGKSTTE